MTVNRIFKSFGLKIYNVEEIVTHGGSIRIYGCHENETRRINVSVNKILNREYNKGLNKLDTYKNFQNKIDLVKNKLDITFANEQEITSLIEARNFDEVINFSKKLNKLVVVTRGEKGAVAVNGDEVVESDIQKNLKIIDLTGAGDLFAAGFLHGYINKLSTKECLEKGTEMSSKVIQQIGARL